jgi:hypothetical protein
LEVDTGGEEPYSQAHIDEAFQQVRRDVIRQCPPNVQAYEGIEREQEPQAQVAQAADPPFNEGGDAPYVPAWAPQKQVITAPPQVAGSNGYDRSERAGVSSTPGNPASEKQWKLLDKLCAEQGIVLDTLLYERGLDPNSLSSRDASATIEALMPMSKGPGRR